MTIVDYTKPTLGIYTDASVTDVIKRISGRLLTIQTYYPGCTLMLQSLTAADCFTSKFWSPLLQKT